MVERWRIIYFMAASSEKRAYYQYVTNEEPNQGFYIKEGIVVGLGILATRIVVLA
jgi:hypothetical protein